MRTLFVTLILIAITSIVNAQSSLLIENVTVISSHVPEAQDNSFVLILDGRIVQVGDRNMEFVEDDILRIDGQGKFLIPGIFDSHVHVSSIPGLGFASEERASQHSELVGSYFAQQPLSHLYFGVTQVIDPNPGASWRQYESAPIRPHYFRCEVITSFNTFPFVEQPFDTAKKLYPYVLTEDDTEETRLNSRIVETVEQIADSGAICIKLYFEDGYGDANNWPLLPDGIIEKIILAAHDHDLKVIAHANALDMYQKALSFDIDVMAHGLWGWGEDNSNTDVPESITSVLEELVSARVGFMPTLRIIAGLGELMDSSITEGADFRKVTPTLLQDWYAQPDAQWFRSELLEAEGLTPLLFTRIYRNGIVGRGARAMRHLNNSGYPLLLGSDTPGSPSYINQPGWNTYHEMRLMFEEGIPLAEVFDAATINNARQFNLDSDYGTVEAGKIANLLLLSENPMEKIEAWNSIDIVILNGIPIDRTEFIAEF